MNNGADGIGAVAATKQGVSGRSQSRTRTQFGPNRGIPTRAVGIASYLALLTRLAASRFLRSLCSSILPSHTHARLAHFSHDSTAPSLLVTHPSSFVTHISPYCQTAISVRLSSFSIHLAQPALPPFLLPTYAHALVKVISSFHQSLLITPPQSPLLPLTHSYLRVCVQV